MTTKSQELIVPALRAKMGDWIYYITFLRMQDIADRISIAAEIHTSETLKDFIQRQITDRAKQISEYLLEQPQRFFNALIVGVYGGSPNWYELSIGKNPQLDIEELPQYIEGALGILRFEGSEKLFAIDGQHRVQGIKKAVEEDSGLGDEEVSVIFLAHRNDPDGKERTRRLFTNLNRYAKPVSKEEIIALDEDDVIAITTRDLVEKHPLFSEAKISFSRTKAISTTDNESFTTIITLYDVLDILLKEGGIRSWSNFKKFRPDESTVSEFYNRAEHFWNKMIEYFPPLREVKDSAPGDGIAERYRHRNGGHLLFRPVGLLLVTRVIRRMKDSGVEIGTAIKLVSRAPIDLTCEPWVGLLWDNINKRMITAAVNQRVAGKLLFYMVGGEIKTTELKELKQEYAGILNKTEDEITLPPKTRRNCCRLI